jgi:hypothetical protein
MLHELGPYALDRAREYLRQQIGTGAERDEFEHAVFLRERSPPLGIILGRAAGRLGTPVQV